MPALAFALLIAAGAMPAPKLGEAGERTIVRAELGELSLVDNVMRGEGGVVLESGGLALRADLLEYDLAAREGSAAGNLVFVDGDIVLLADEGLFALGGNQRLTIREATLLQKRKPAAFGSVTAAGARGSGRNELILQAEQIERIARSRFVARRLRMTFCDCGEGCTPDWSISALSADVVIGERAILRWPTFRIRDVPVLLLPALYLPLSDRRTGLLFPEFGWKNGPIYDQPFFLTLGESYDLTLTLGGRVGFKPDDPTARSPTRGARASAELRYFPIESTSGRLFVAGMNDRGSEGGRDPRGWRGELALRHRTELDGGLGLQADAKIVSDALYLTDEATDIMRAAAIPYLRSQAHGFWRTENALLTLSSGWYQECEKTLFESGFTPERRLFGPEAPISFQRPIAARLQVPRLAIFGPVRAGLEIEAAHYRPIAPGGPMTVERLQRSWLTEDSKALPLSLSRLDARPSLSISIFDRGPVHLEAYAAGRGDVSAYAPVVGDGPRRTDLWGRAIAGLWAGTEVSRVYGQGEGALRHSIAPRLELRASTPEYGERTALDGFVLPVDEYDLYQRAADPRLLQGIASVSTRLSRRNGGDLLHLELGQGFDFASGALGDSYGRLELGSRFVTVGAAGRYDHAQREFSALGARLGLRDGRGDALSVSYDRLLASGTDRMRAGLDDLFGPSPTVDVAVGSMDQVNLSATFKPLRTVSLGYGLTLLPRAEDKVYAHSGSLGLSSDCDCWKVRLVGGWLPKPEGVEDVFTFGITLELKNLGSFGR